MMFSYLKHFYICKFFLKYGNIFLTKLNLKGNLPMKITGSHTCEKCNTIIEWEHIVRQRQPQVEQIDRNKAHPIEIIEIAKNKYLLQIRCRKCDFPNNITYHSEKRL